MTDNRREASRGQAPSARRQAFEELPVWQSALRLAEAVFDLTGSEGLVGRYALRDQLERAALSVSYNIAEGWEQGTHEELLSFLYYARGSCGEVRSMLRFLSQRDWLGVGREADRLIELALDTSRQLGAWLESLKNTESRGPRYRTMRPVARRTPHPEGRSSFRS
jgi:four helix bundle protein